MCYYFGNYLMPIMYNDNDSNTLLVLICIHREMIDMDVIGSA